MTVTRVPEHAGYTALGAANRPGEDYLLLVGGVVIGGSYWCGSSETRRNERWASSGPAGLSMRHRTRADAEQAQVDAYVDRAARAARRGRSLQRSGRR